MRTEELDCANCTPEINKSTEHIIVGHIPQLMFEDTESNLWVNATVCSRCGSLNAREVSEREMNQAERRYLYALVESDHMSTEEAKEILGS